MGSPHLYIYIRKRDTPLITYKQNHCNTHTLSLSQFYQQNEWSCCRGDGNVSASKAWEVYGSVLLSQLVGKALKEKGLEAGFVNAEVVEGSGGVGTILHAIFVPGNASGFASFKEKFVKLDNEKRVKETEMIEGGYIDLGFSHYRMRFEVKEKSEDWCITRITAEYEVKEADEDQVAAINASSAKLLFTILGAAKEYLMLNKK